MKKSLTDFTTLRGVIKHICYCKNQGARQCAVWTVDSLVALIHGWYTAVPRKDIEVMLRTKYTDVSFPEELYGLLAIGNPTQHQVTHSTVVHNKRRISVSCYVALQKLKAGPMTPAELGILDTSARNWISNGLVEWDGTHLSLPAKQIETERSILDICMDNLVRRKMDVQME